LEAQQNGQGEKTPALSQEEAMEALKKDFGEEGLDTLLAGVDSLLDLTGKFGMPYHQLVEKMKSDEKAGLIRKVGDTYIAVEKVEKEDEN